MRGLFKAAAWLLLLSAVSVCGLRRGVQRREQLTVSRAGPLGVRLSKELRVLEVLDSGSPLLVEDRITAVNGVSVADDELHEFKDKLDQVQVPYVLSVDRLVLDQQNEAEKREAKLFMDSNDHPDILSSSLKAREVELRLHLPVVSVKRAQALEVQNFVSEAAEFSGPFSCDYRRLLVATPEDGCHVEAKDKKKQMYKDSIVIVKRGVCSFFTKGNELKFDCFISVIGLSIRSFECSRSWSDGSNYSEYGRQNISYQGPSSFQGNAYSVEHEKCCFHLSCLQSLASVVMVSKSSGKEIMGNISLFNNMNCGQTKPIS